MASYYGVIFPEFWTGRTGRELRTRGGKDAQLLALYLATNRHTNMLGLYRLMADDVSHETGLSDKAIEKAWQAVSASSFAVCDEASAFVWVHQMARFRLGLKLGASLDAGDNRVLAVNRIYHALEDNPFLGPFFDANRKALRLKTRREGTTVSNANTVQKSDASLVVDREDDHNGSGLEGAYQGACKPDTEIRDQRSETEIRDQRKATRLAPRENGHANASVIKALVASVHREQPTLGFTDLKEATKAKCARLAIDYDAQVVGSAIEQVLAREAKAS